MGKKKEKTLTTISDIEKGLTAKLPAWIPQHEDVANSMFDTAQEMLLAVDDVLIRYFHFEEDKLRIFHTHLKDMLTGVKEYEKHGFNLLSPNSVEAVGDLVQTRLIKHRMGRAGMEYPILPGGADLLTKVMGKQPKQMNAKK